MAETNIVLQISDGSINTVIPVAIVDLPWSIQAVWAGLDNPVLVTPKQSNDGGNYNNFPSSPLITSSGAGGSASIDGIGITHKYFRVELDVQAATTGTVALHIQAPDNNRSNF